MLKGRREWLSVLLFHQTISRRQEALELIAMMAISYVRTNQTDRAIALLQEKSTLDTRIEKIVSQLRQGRIDEATTGLKAMALPGRPYAQPVKNAGP